MHQKSGSTFKVNMKFDKNRATYSHLSNKAILCTFYAYLKQQPEPNFDT